MAWRLFRRWGTKLGVLSFLIALGVLLWHLVPPQPRCRIPAVDYSCEHLFQDGCKVILANDDDNQLQLWDTVAGKHLQTFFLNCQKDFPSPFFWAISPGERYLAWLDEERYRIFDLMEERQIPLERKLSGDFSISSCGRNYFCLSGQQSTLVVELATGRVLKEYPVGTGFGERRDFFSSKGDFFLLNIPLKGKVIVDHIPTGRRIVQANWEDGDYHFSPHSRYLVFYNNEKNVLRAWDLQTGRENLHLNGVIDYEYSKEDGPHFAPEYRLLLTLKKGRKEIDIWEMGSGKKKFWLNFSPWVLEFFAFSPDGNFLAVLVSKRPEKNDAFAEPKMVLKILAAESGQEVWQQPMDHWESQGIGFKKDCQNLLVPWTGRTESFGEVFDFKTGKKQVEWGGGILLETSFSDLLWVKWFKQNPNSFFTRVLDWLGLPWPRDCMEIFDPWTGRSKGKLYLKSLQGLWGPTNRTLITISKEELAYLIWDIPLQPPLRWVVGPPLALGLLLLALAYWRRRRQLVRKEPPFCRG